jgi:hypothetical protein
VYLAWWSSLHDLLVWLFVAGVLLLLERRPSARLLLLHVRRRATTMLRCRATAGWLTTRRQMLRCDGLLYRCWLLMRSCLFEWSVSCCWLRRRRLLSEIGRCG